MSASSLTVPQIRLELGQLVSDRNHELRQLDAQIAAIQDKKVLVENKYINRIQELERQLRSMATPARSPSRSPPGQTRTEQAAASLHDLKLALAKLDGQTGGGLYEEDAGVLASLIKELKKNVRSGVPDNSTLDVLRKEHLDPSWYDPEIEKLVDEVLRLYDDWDYLTTTPSSRSMSRSPSPASAQYN